MCTAVKEQWVDLIAFLCCYCNIVPSPKLYMFAFPTNCFYFVYCLFSHRVCFSNSLAERENSDAISNETTEGEPRSKGCYALTLVILKRLSWTCSPYSVSCRLKKKVCKGKYHTEDVPVNKSISPAQTYAFVPVVEWLQRTRTGMFILMIFKQNVVWIIIFNRKVEKQEENSAQVQCVKSKLLAYQNINLKINVQQFIWELN